VAIHEMPPQICWPGSSPQWARVMLVVSNA
jgi:hypothetical protein